MEVIKKNMKWCNHKAAGFGIAYLATGNFIIALASATFSTLPDWIEGMGFFRILKHRGLSHMPQVWLAILTVLAAFISHIDGFDIASMYLSFLPQNLGTWIIAALFFGIVSHLACDSLTMSGIPLSFNGRRTFALKLFRTGDGIEYLLTGVFVLIVLAVRLLHII